MAVPKKRVSKTRKNLRHTNWKKEIIPQALQALSLGKSKNISRTRGLIDGNDLGIKSAPSENP
jgi:ribosomal protein L32